MLVTIFSHQECDRKILPQKQYIQWTKRTEIENAMLPF